LKTTILKLGVLSNNLSRAKSELGENENLNTSLAQLHALIDNLNHGLESQHN
jgi:hypothetical protein